MPKEPKKKKKLSRDMTKSAAGGGGSSSTARHGHAHAPLGQVIQDDENRGKFATRKLSVGTDFSRSRIQADGDGDGEEEEDGGLMLDAQTSRRILDIANEQRREMELLEEDEGAMQMMTNAAGRRTMSKVAGTSHTPKGVARRRGGEEEDSSSSEEEHSGSGSGEDEDDQDDDEEEGRMVKHGKSGYVSMSAQAIGLTLTPEEEALLSNMMGRGGKGTGGSTDNYNDYEIEDGMPQSRNLADIIMAKIAEKEALAHRRANHEDDDGNGEEEMVGQLDLPPKVVQVYTDIGKLLAHYTSGKLPKAFKVLPSLHNWEEVLYLTRPDTWTPQAMYAATRIFASNLNPKMAQRFHNLVLLDAVRADIHTNRKLNYHYYTSLKKAVYKPAAFFKGILLPLCNEESNCTLREAIIVASVLQKVSIPVQHSAVALHKLATMRVYNGAMSIFMRTLLDKKYSLPKPVIDSLIAHFVRFKDNNDIGIMEEGVGGASAIRELPVLWHQALLVFVQRYKNDISVTGKEQLRDLMKVQNHPKITVEVRRELFGSAAWKEERGSCSTTIGGGGGNDDGMVM